MAPNGNVTPRLKLREMASLPHPSVVTRSDWGCPEKDGASPQYTSVTHLIIHHSAITRRDEDWRRFVLDVWEFHVLTKGWDDIGYNFLIDPAGVIYEGRAGGDDVRGAHFICANENTMGVALIGNFEETLPSELALESLTRLLAWKSDQRGIDPLGSTFHPATQLMLSNIAGHCDGNDASPDSSACPVGTVCPGSFLYRMLPTIRDNVRDLILTQGTGEK